MEEINNEMKVNHGLKLMAKSSLVVFVSLLFSKILNYVYRIVIARDFGPEMYGLFAITLMIGSIFIAFFSMGLADGLLRYVSFYRGKNEYFKINYLFRYVLKATLFSGIIASLILLIFSDFISMNLFHNEKLIIFLRIFSLIIPITLFYNIFGSILKSFEKVSWFSFIENFLQNLVKLLFLIFLIFIGFGANSIIFSYLFGMLFVLITSYIVSKKIIPRVFKKEEIVKRESAKIRKEFISYSWPIMFHGLLYTLFTMTDSFVVGYFKDAVQVGIYNAAVAIGAMIWFVPSLFTQLFLPLVTKEYSNKNIEFVREIGKQIGKWIFILNLPIFLIMVFFPGAIINILFGSQYVIAEHSLRLLSLGIFVSSIGSFLSGDLIYMVGKSKTALYCLIITSVINLLLDIVLIPSYGIVGAAFATMVSLILLSAQFSIIAYRYVKFIPLRRKIFRILTASLIPLLILVYLTKLFPINRLNLILFSSLFLLLYLLLIFVFGCMDKNDFMILKTIKEKLFKKAEE